VLFADDRTWFTMGRHELLACRIGMRMVTVYPGWASELNPTDPGAVSSGDRQEESAALLGGGIGTAGKQRQQESSTCQ
jgi:hypothetical protein